MCLIPDNFAHRMIQMNGEAGRAWIESLPLILDEIAERWSLKLGAPFELSYNYVAPAIRADGTEAVLKLGLPNRELLSEMHALQVFDGHGMVQLLEADFDDQIFLLERVRPGVELITLENDDEAVIRIAAQVMKQYWRPINDDRPLLTVENWTGGLAKLRHHFNDTTGPFPAYLVEAAEYIFSEFIPSQGEQVLLHGDLHHWNILSATRQPWLAIDLKGVIGEREYDIGAILRNPWGKRFDLGELKRIQSRRVDILCEILGFERQRILGWGVAQAVLSAWWSVEDEGHGWEPALAYAKALYRIMNPSVYSDRRI
jgi:streptomycin 6-kinase